MALFRNLLIGLGLMLAGLYIAANMMDPHWQVNVETTVNTQASVRLDEKLIKAKAWEEWMYVNPTNFPKMKFSYLSKTEGIGTTQRWCEGVEQVDGKAGSAAEQRCSGVSEGLRTLHKYDDDRVIYHVRHNTLKYAEEIRITQTASGYQLKMRVHGELGPVNRLVFWLFHQSRMTHNYAASLQQLKQLVEKTN